MIRFSDNLYVSDSIKEHKLPLYKLGIRQGRGKLKLYLLVLSNNEHDQLDIIHNSILKNEKPTNEKEIIKVTFKIRENNLNCNIKLISLKSTIATLYQIYSLHYFLQYQYIYNKHSSHKFKRNSKFIKI